MEVEDLNPSLTRKTGIKLAKISKFKNPAQQAEEKTSFPRHWPSPMSGILPDCLHLEGLPMMDPQYVPLGQLQEKAKQYEHAEWWVRKPSAMACPLLCLAKKDGSLQTVIDARNRNANSVLDITPMPDMHFIMDSLAWNTY